MSQAKVDRYKENKKNRAKNIKKEKREKLILRIGGIAVAAIFVVWIGFSGYKVISNNVDAKGKTYSVDTAAIDEYLNDLSTTVEE